MINWQIYISFLSCPLPDFDLFGGAGIFNILILGSHFNHVNEIMNSHECGGISNAIG